jgi:hypothetical protein
MILAIKRGFKCVDEAIKRADHEVAIFLEGQAYLREYHKHTLLTIPSRAPARDSPCFDDIPPAQMHACWVKHFTLTPMDDVNMNAISDNIVQLCTAWECTQAGSSVAAEGAVTK